MRRTIVVVLMLAVLITGCIAYVVSPADDRFPRQFAELAGGTANVYDVTTEFADQKNVDEYCRAFQKEDSLISDRGRFTLKYRTYIRNPEEKGAIVISSGRTESFLIYPELIYDLGKQGYSVYIHDHRGQGLSQRLLKDDAEAREKSHVETFDDYVADLRKFVRDVVKPETHRSTFLVAHSMGGGIASLYIEKYPDDFDGAVLVTPMHEPSLPVNNTALCFLNGLIPHALGDGWAVRQKKYDPELQFAKNDLTHSKRRWERTRAVYKNASGARLGGITHQWLHAACDAGAATRQIERVKNIRIPVLLLQASEDTAVDKEAQDEFCDKVNDVSRGSCEAYVLRGALHAVFIESDPFRIPALTKMIEFMNRHAES